MFKYTSFAVSHEESRYVLNGVLMEISDNKIKIISENEFLKTIKEK